MAYWDTKERRKELREAYNKFKKSINIFADKAVLGKECPRTPFDKMHQICKDFKKNFYNKPKGQILDELHKLSEYKMVCRQSYDKRRGQKHGFFKPKKCFICKTNKATSQHHIVLLKNGGYDNGINRIPICHTCHNLVHPWMLEDTLTKEYKEIFK